MINKGGGVAFDYLGDRGKQLFAEYSEMCSKIGIDITGARTHEVMALAAITEEFEKLALFIKENGSTQKTPSSDYRQISPEFSNMMKAYDSIVKHLTKLGVYEIAKTPKEKENDAQETLRNLRKVN